MKRFIVIFLFLLLISGCQRDSNPVLSNTQKSVENTAGRGTPEPLEKSIVVSNGNLFNSSGVIENDGWIYYSDYNDNWRFKRKTLDGKRTELLNDASAWDINIYDDWLIYTELPYECEAGVIVKSKLDGSEKTVLSKDEAYGISLYKSDIYYADYYIDGYIYKMSIDGDDKQLVIDKRINSFSICENKILVSVFSDEYLYEYDLISKEIKVLCDKPIQIIWEYNNRYYGFSGRDNFLYSMNKDGTGIKQVSNINGYSFNYANGWIYYKNSNDNLALYKSKIDGSELTKLSSDKPSNIYIYNDVVYYIGKDYQVHKISIDGGESSMVN